MDRASPFPARSFWRHTENTKKFYTVRRSSHGSRDSARGTANFAIDFPHASRTWESDAVFVFGGKHFTVYLEIDGTWKHFDGDRVTDADPSYVATKVGIPTRPGNDDRELCCVVYKGEESLVSAAVLTSLWGSKSKRDRNRSPRVRRPFACSSDPAARSLLPTRSLPRPR